MKMRQKVSDVYPDPLKHAMVRVGDFLVVEQGASPKSTSYYQVARHGRKGIVLVCVARASSIPTRPNEYLKTRARVELVAESVATGMRGVPLPTLVRLLGNDIVDSTFMASTEEVVEAIKHNTPSTYHSPLACQEKRW